MRILCEQRFLRIPLCYTFLCYLLSLVHLCQFERDLQPLFGCQLRPQIAPQFRRYRIRVQGPPGKEQLKLFATTEDVPLYVRDYSQTPFNSVNDGDAVRGLVATFEKMPETDWAEASWEFQVERVLR